MHFVQSRRVRLLHPRAEVTMSFSPSSCDSIRSVKEGKVHNSVDQDLYDMYKKEFESITETSRVKKVYYCQSKVELLSDAGQEIERKPRKWGDINHDFLVVHMTASDANGKELSFFIFAEKSTSRDQDPEKTGIFIKARRDAGDIDKNVCQTWECYSIPISMESLTRTLWVGHDTGYNVLSNNCWNYAKDACKKLLRKLSDHPKATEAQKHDLITSAGEVTERVVTDAAQGASDRAVRYVAKTVFLGKRTFF